MSSLVIDLVIWLLLFIGAGFGLIGLIGLLIFPDTRSRMYTSIRATLIGISAVGLAVIIYGLYALQASGGNMYGTLLLHTLMLVVVIATGNYVVSRIILDPLHPPGEKPSPREKTGDGGDKK